MANSFNNPMVLDTDFTSYRTAATKTTGIRAIKLMFVVGGSAASAGSVAITNAENSQVLYPPIGVVAATAANTVILNDNPPGQAIYTWPDFGVSGLTATGVKLYIWWGL